mgnify:CR=1 FL=1
MRIIVNDFLKELRKYRKTTLYLLSKRPNRTFYIERDIKKALSDLNKRNSKERKNG